MRLMEMDVCRRALFSRLLSQEWLAIWFRFGVDVLAAVGVLVSGAWQAHQAPFTSRGAVHLPRI
jgi:hypothetical protein